MFRQILNVLQVFNPLSAKLGKRPNTLKQFVGNLPTNCLSVFGDFVGFWDVMHWRVRNKYFISTFTRSSHPEVFLKKGILKIFSKFRGEHPCRCVISIKLQSNFIEITPLHGCSPVNLQHIFRTLFLGTPLSGCFLFT